MIFLRDLLVYIAFCIYVANAARCDELHGRYVGFGRGTLEDGNVVQGIVNVMLRNANVNGTAHVQQQGDEIRRFAVEGTYQATPSTAPSTDHDDDNHDDDDDDNHDDRNDDDDAICLLEARITGLGRSVLLLRGYTDGDDRLALVALNTTMLLELERAPTRCSNSSLGEQGTSLVSTSLVHDEDTGELVAAATLQAVVVQRNTLDYAYIATNGASDTSRTTFAVDSSCAVEFENGFVGAVFDDGFAYLGKRSGMILGGTFDEN